MNFLMLILGQNDLFSLSKHNKSARQSEPICKLKLLTKAYNVQ